MPFVAYLRQDEEVHVLLTGLVYQLGELLVGQGTVEAAGPGILRSPRPAALYLNLYIT